MNDIDRLRKILERESRRHGQSFDQPVDTTMFCTPEERMLYKHIARGLDRQRMRLACREMMLFVRIVDPNNLPLTENRLRLINYMLKYVETLP